MVLFRYSTSVLACFLLILAAATSWALAAQSAGETATQKGSESTPATGPVQGEVKPARENFYGGGLTLPVWEGGFLTLNGSQNKIRGNVNGNVLIPLAEERTPLSDDPELSSIVQTLLDSYPNEEPNRQDIADRAHNTNSLQLINTDTANIQLDQSFRDRDRLAFHYTFTSQNIDAFQLVTGQNPDTDNKNHWARVTWNRTWSPSTITDVSVGSEWETCFSQQRGPSGPC